MLLSTRREISSGRLKSRNEFTNKSNSRTRNKRRKTKPVERQAAAQTPIKRLLFIHSIGYSICNVPNDGLRWALGNDNSRQCRRKACVVANFGWTRSAWSMIAPAILSSLWYVWRALVLTFHSIAMTNIWSRLQRQRDLGVDPISGWYVTYRFLLAAFFLSVLVASGSTSTKPHLWFIYLTHLGFLVQTVHLVVSAALQVELLLKGKHDTDTNKSVT